MQYRSQSINLQDSFVETSYVVCTLLPVLITPEKRKYFLAEWWRMARDVKHLIWMQLNHWQRHTKPSTIVTTKYSLSIDNGWQQISVLHNLTALTTYCSWSDLYLQHSHFYSQLSPDMARDSHAYRHMCGTFPGKIPSPLLVARQLANECGEFPRDSPQPSLAQTSPYLIIFAERQDTPTLTSLPPVPLSPTTVCTHVHTHTHTLTNTTPLTHIILNTHLLHAHIIYTENQKHIPTQN